MASPAWSAKEARKGAPSSLTQCETQAPACSAEGLRQPRGSTGRSGGFCGTPSGRCSAAKRIIADGGNSQATGGDEGSIERRLSLLGDMVAGAGVVGEHVGRQRVEVSDAFGRCRRLRLDRLDDYRREQTPPEGNQIPATPGPVDLAFCQLIRESGSRENRCWLLERSPAP